MKTIREYINLIESTQQTVAEVVPAVNKTPDSIVNAFNQLYPKIAYDSNGNDLMEPEEAFDEVSKQLGVSPRKMHRLLNLDKNRQPTDNHFEKMIIKMVGPILWRKMLDRVDYLRNHRNEVSNQVKKDYKNGGQVGIPDEILYLQAVKDFQSEWDKATNGTTGPIWMTYLLHQIEMNANTHAR